MIDVNSIADVASSAEILPVLRRLQGNYVVWIGGRIAPVSSKRPCDFVELARRFPDIAFVMPGKVSAGELSQICGPLPENLLVLSLKPYNYRRDIFLRIVKGAGLAVLTSYFDTFPYSVLEAISLGVPSLVPDTGGPPEIVNRRVGAIYKTGDVDSLCEVFTKVWMRVQDGKYNAEVLRQYISEKYGVDVILPKIFRVYESVL